MSVSVEIPSQLSVRKSLPRARLRSDLAARRARISDRPLSVAGHIVVDSDGLSHTRRAHDDTFAMSQKFIIDIESTLQYLTEHEDTDNDGHITIEDVGPKTIFLGTEGSNGYRKFPILGTYAISNLFQDLSAANDEGRFTLELQSSQLNQDPVARLSGLINNRFWNHLTRRLDAEVIEKALQDGKRSERKLRRLYVPADCEEQYEHYVNMAKAKPSLSLVVEKLTLPTNRAEYRKLANAPGLLALDMDRTVNPKTGKTELHAVPFVVPGGWFNEFFGWDSYFIGLGLFIADKADLVKCIVRNWIFEIQHYGLIPNANRSYFILRSQPPFLTDLCIRLYKATSSTDSDAKTFLKRGIEAAIKEYLSVWTAKPYLDEETGLSRYRPKGYGIPPEVDLEFFRPILEPFAEKHGLSVEELARQFDEGHLEDEELEDYFLHDRALRESGHDTQNRLEGRTADLAIIDLNCLLYKCEVDIANAIDEIFEGDFELTAEFTLPINTSADCKAATWRERAAKRKEAMDKYLWNEDRGIYVDYNTKTKKQEVADSATCLWALWCGVANEHQAELLVKNSLPFLECEGGLATCSKETGYMYKRRKYQSQWDYPHGWAPHQMLAWDGLQKYGFREEASRLAYRWLSTILTVFVHYNGAVVEKYDVTRPNVAHQVDTEYPNQGFSYQAYVKEGFGWTNASFVYGLQFLDPQMRRALGVLAPWEAVAANR